VDTYDRVHAVTLISDYERNEAAADDEYKGKVFIVEGDVKLVYATWPFGEKFILLQTLLDYDMYSSSILGIQCSISTETPVPILRKLLEDKAVVVLGRCTGVRSGDINFDSCSVFLPE